MVEKIVGAAAEEDWALTRLKELGDRVNAGTRSMGVALTSCTVPTAGHHGGTKVTASKAHNCLPRATNF